MSVSSPKQDVVLQFAETGLDEGTVAQAMELAPGALTNDQLASLVEILAPGSTVSVKGSADHAYGSVSPGRGLDPATVRKIRKRLGTMEEPR